MKLLNRDTNVLLGTFLKLFRGGFLPTEAFFKIVSSILQQQRCEGPKMLVKKLKIEYQLVVKYLVGTPIFKVSEARISITKEGLPRRVPKILRDRIIRGDRLITRLVLTVLSLHRLIRWSEEFDSRSITEPSTKPIEDVIKKAPVKEFIDLLSKTCKGPLLEQSKLHQRRFHLTNKVGPNRHALVSAHLDLISLIHTGKIHHLIQYAFGIKDSASAMNLMSYANRKLTSREWAIDPKSLIHSKLSVKLDVSGKQRVFAILDYWSQSLLKPLHDSLARILKRIPTDATFDQDRGSQLVSDFTRTPDEIHSLDLTAATDRMPLLLQERILSEIGNQIGLTDLASSWSRLIAKREFAHKGKFYSYRVGQPMGAYSSWAMMALTHHFIVQWAAAEQTKFKDWFGGYCILGDDVVIANASVAKRYQEILSSLDMNISQFKSLQSKGSAEFVKRLFINGKEWSPAPVTEVFEFVQRISLFPELIQTLVRRDFPITLMGALSPWLRGQPSWDTKPTRLAYKTWVSLTAPTGPFPDLFGTLEDPWYRRSAWVGITPAQIGSASYQETFKSVSKTLEKISQQSSALSGQDPDWQTKLLILTRGVPLRSVLSLSEHPYYRVLKDLFQDLQEARAELIQRISPGPDVTPKDLLTSSSYRIPSFSIEVMRHKLVRVQKNTKLAVSVHSKIHRNPDSYSGSSGGLALT